MVSSREAARPLPSTYCTQLLLGEGILREGRRAPAVAEEAVAEVAVAEEAVVEEAEAEEAEAEEAVAEEAEAERRRPVAAVSVCRTSTRYARRTSARAPC
jgi:hypothetical protein